MPDVDLEALKQRQIAFFQRRIVSYEEWRMLLERGHDALLCRRVSDLVEIDGLAAAIDAGFEKPALRKGVFPLAAEVHKRVRAEASKDSSKVGAYVPESARTKLDDLLSRPGVVPEKLIRQLCEQEAVEELLRDTLYDGIKEFNEKVNPFFADWGLAGLLKKMPGFGLVSRSMENVRAEFDKRLDPEIRKFLQGFSRRALRKMADTIVQRKGDAKSVALRRALLTWLWDQPVNELAGGGDDERARLSREIAFDIVEHSSALETMRERRRKAIADFLRDHGGRTVGEVLHEMGATERPDFDAAAHATWPVVKSILESPAVRDRIAAVVEEFFSEER